MKSGPSRKWRSGRAILRVPWRPIRPGPTPRRVFRDALQGGAVSIGELKYHLALDSPEMRRVYDIAAEMQVPVMMHIQNFPHFEGELPYNTGYPQFDKILQRLSAKPISLDTPTSSGPTSARTSPPIAAIPPGPIKPGGLTDRWLSDFPNLYADMSANSGNNALSRDPDFTREFIIRHKSKLIFGSDCSCTDGKGAGISQGNNPEASRLAGKCVARATLGLLKESASQEIFHQVTWETQFSFSSFGLTAEGRNVGAACSRGSLDH